MVIIIMSLYLPVFLALFSPFCVVFVGYLWDVCGEFVGLKKYMQ
jgi:hypothetical protein